MKIRMHRRFFADTTASIAIIYAVMASCLMMFASLSMELANGFFVKSRLNDAGDAALIAGLKEARSQFLLTRMAGTNSTVWRTKGLAIAKSFFKETAKTSGGTVQSYTVDIVQERAEISATLSYKATAPDPIIQIFRTEPLEITGTVKARFGLETYIDVNLVVDISESMGIGADEETQRKMYAVTGCAFACHVEGYTPTHWDPIRNAGFRMRIDVVRDGIVKFIHDLKSKRRSEDQVRLSITLFSTGVTPYFAPSTDLDAALEAARKINLDLTTDNESTNVNYATNLVTAGLKQATVGGDGFGVNDRLSYAILLTDGIENDRDRRSPFFETSPSYKFYWYQLQAPPAFMCDGLKADNREVLVGHINYLIPPDDIAGKPQDKRAFKEIDQVLTPVARNNLKACASGEKDYFQAGETPEVSVMFNKILDRLVASMEISVQY